MSESDSRDKKFVTSLVQSESGKWRVAPNGEARKKRRKKERVGSFALSQPSAVCPLYLNALTA